MSKYTPMIEQYLAIKREAGDAILMFRLGDFYEMFFEDAILAARELEITLTGRDGGAEERIPMCGVPYHSADAYISRLVDKGYKVAICEQMEDPAAAKGVVRREIVRIVTPGTVMDGKALAEAGNNFIACVAGDGGRYGLAVCDLSTGELHATAVEPAADRLVDELYVYKPAELIGEAALIDETARLLPPAVRPRRTEAVGEADPALVARQFGEGADGLHPAAAKAVAMLLSFLLATQKRTLSHIRRLNLYEPKRYLILDPFTRRNLELTETVRDRSKTGSLLWLLDRTVTAIGARMLRRWIEKPLMDASEINARLEAVECLAGQFIVRDELRDHLKRIYDLERLAGRIAYGTANARDLLALAASLAAVPAIAGLLAASGSKTLAALAEGLDDCGDIREWIDAAIDENAPATIREGGMIKAGYDKRLDKFREAGSSGKRWMAELEAREREATGIKSLKLGYNKVFGYYIEVTKPNLHLVPEGRYERKQTLANAERFVTPELKEKEALILEAEERMVALEYELFCALRDRIAGEIGRLQHLADVLARVDALQSLADVSAARGYTKPVITDGYRLRISAGRHPVVEAVLEDGRFVANDTELSEERGSMLLITGPNMAGKSTYMRQVALIVIMAQIGCFVPARIRRNPHRRPDFHADRRRRRPDRRPEHLHGGDDGHPRHDREGDEEQPRHHRRAGARHVHQRRDGHRPGGDRIFARPDRLQDAGVHPFPRTGPARGIAGRPAQRTDGGEGGRRHRHVPAQADARCGGHELRHLLRQNRRVARFHRQPVLRASPAAGSPGGRAAEARVLRRAAQPVRG